MEDMNESVEKYSKQREKPELRLVGGKGFSIV